LQGGALLVVPGCVGAGARFDVPYEATWQRFTAELSKATPAAENAKVILGIETAVLYRDQTPQLEGSSEETSIGSQ
jgi:hypothetical protein